MKYRLIDIILGVTTLVFTCLFFIPLTVYALNQKEFLSHPSEMVRFLAFLCAGVTVAGVAVLLGLGKSSRRFSIPALAFLTLGVWIQGYVFNWDYGSFDGSELAFQLIALRSADLLAWAVLAILVIGLGLKKQLSFRPLFIILLLTQSVSLFMAFNTAGSLEVLPEQEEDVGAMNKTHQFTFSEADNIIILTLDAFQTDVFNEYLEAHPEFAGKIPGFTYYPDTVATSYFSAHSIPVIFTGRAFDANTSFSAYLSDAYQNYSMAAKLKEAGYYVGIYNYFSLAQSCFHPNLFTGIADNYSGEEEYVASYYAHEVRRILLTGLFRLAPHIARNAIYTRWLLEAPLEQDRDIFARDFQHFSRVNGAQPRLNYYHLQGLHQPLVIDGERLDWQDREAIRQVAALLCELIETFVNRIQRLGIYEDAAIFIIADHGLLWDPDHLHFGRFDSPQLRDTPPLDVFAKKVRALPLVLFKPPGAGGDLVVSHRPVSLKDLTPTVLDLAGLDYRTDYEGKSLLRSDENWQARPFFTSEYRSRSNGPLYEYAISGFSWYDSSWNFTGKVHHRGQTRRMPLDAYLPGTTLTFGVTGNGQQYADARWQTTDSDHIARGGKASIALPIEQLDVHPMLHVVLSADSGRSQQLQARINGKASEVFTITDRTELQLPVPIDGLTFSGPATTARPSSVWLAPAPRVPETTIEIVFESLSPSNSQDAASGESLETGAFRLHTLTLVDGA